MSRRQVPKVNASLIREARMFYNQFFGHKPDNYYSMRIAEARAQAQAKAPICTHTALKCSLCDDGIVADAKFVINGFSVCAAHEAKARTASNRPLFG